jgi:hypothetical protein
MVGRVADTGVLLRRFLDGGDERLPRLAETKRNISVHTVGMELIPNCLPNTAILVSDFSGEAGGIVKQNGVARVDAVFSCG